MTRLQPRHLITSRQEATPKSRMKRESPHARRHADQVGSIKVGGHCRNEKGSLAYVYAILVDGVVRYIGKGRNGRMYNHLIEAKRSAARCAIDTSGLFPRRHRKLVEAVRAGSQFTETVIISGLTDRVAYGLESKIINEFHKRRAGQLWNTIDERFMDPQFLPDEWDDPEHPLYKLRRPLVRNQMDSPEDNRYGTARDQPFDLKSVAGMIADQCLSADKNRRRNDQSGCKK